MVEAIEQCNALAMRSRIVLAAADGMSVAR